MTEAKVIRIKSNNTVKNGYACLSNFWPFVKLEAQERAYVQFPALRQNDGSFTLDDVKYASVEHYFQAHKYKHQPDVFRLIRTQSTALEAKRANTKQYRKHNNPIDLNAWTAKRDSVMLEALRGKFQQNLQLQEVLVSTFPKKLVEAGRADYWCGADGKLGHLLMQVRQELISEQADDGDHEPSAKRQKLS